MNKGKWICKECGSSLEKLQEIAYWQKMAYWRNDEQYNSKKKDNL